MDGFIVFLCFGLIQLMFHHLLMDDYKQALLDQNEAELNEFGEVASVRAIDIKIIKGSSKFHAEMKQAGYYDDTSFEAITLPMSYYDSTETPYEPLELLVYNGADYLIKNIEELEQGSGVKFIVEKLK
jgi:hypothetical protein